MSAEKLRPACVRVRLVYDWMGRYPRKGADWSPEEDKALIREYESGRYLVKEIASRHLREPVAIERRLGLLHARSAARLSVAREGAKPDINRVRGKQVWGKFTPRQERGWRIEQEKAQRAIDNIRGLFADFMRGPRPGTDLTRLAAPSAEKAGDIIMHDGEPCCVLRVEQGAFGSRVITVERCSNFPPEIAQALQFGGES
jgi:hypothetical protein